MDGPSIKGRGKQITYQFQDLFKEIWIKESYGPSVPRQYANYLWTLNWL